MCSSVITIRDTSGGLALLHSKTKTPQQQQQQHATENILFVKCIFHRKFFLFHEINWNTIFVLHTMHGRTTDRHHFIWWERKISARVYCWLRLLCSVNCMHSLIGKRSWKIHLATKVGCTKFPIRDDAEVMEMNDFRGFSGQPNIYTRWLLLLLLLGTRVDSWKS